MTTESVVSVAVKVARPAVEEVTKNTTMPLVEAPDAAEMVSVAPRLDASVTVLPEIKLLPASFSVMVMVEAIAPSAGTPAGEATTVELFVVGTDFVYVRVICPAPPAPRCKSRHAP